MATLLIWLPETGTFCTHCLESSAQMPHVERLRFSVADFLGRDERAFGWTSAKALRALDALGAGLGMPFSVERAFMRQSAVRTEHAAMHLAGMAFDVGRSLTAQLRTELRHLAVASRLFAQTEPAFSSGRSVRVYLEAALPGLSAGDAGPFVLALQDRLQRAGFYRGALSGRFCHETERAVRRLQVSCGLPANGRADRACWLRALDAAGRMH